MKPRDYQLRGIKDIFRTWEVHDVIMFVLATGGGKTVTFMDVIKRCLMKSLRVVVIAHRDELIKQAWNTLYSNQIYAGIIQGSTPTDFSLPCQVSSIQTLIRRKNLPPADIVIVDEGHHFTDDNSYSKVVQAFWPNAKVLIVTATPYRLSGDGFTSLLPGKETQLIVNCTLKQLTQDGWLVPIRYFLCSMPDLSQVHTSKGEFIEEEARKAMEMVPIIESYTEHAAGKTGIVYAVNVAHSLELTSRYIYAGVPAAHIDANTPQAEREKIMADIRTGMIKVCCNVGILTEGTDFPNLDFVQLAAPTMSLSKYLQEVGRVTRALGGLVDQCATADERKAAIAASLKPHGLVLDNAGLFVTHGGGPYDHNDWEAHFRGEYKKRGKGKSEQDAEEMEMLVYVVEEADGTIRRTSKVKEIEGLRLIEVTKEKHQSVINVVAIKEFDKQYSIARKSPKIKKPGYVAFDKFMTHCRKAHILIIPEMWDYLERKLIKDHHDKWDLVEAYNKEHPGYQPAENIERSKILHFSVAVSRAWFKDKKAAYITANADEIARYMASKKVAHTATTAIQ